MVAISELVISFLLLLKIARWDQVIVTPDDSKIIVLTKGKPHGSKEIMPSGGQIDPISTEGAKLPWKKLKKKKKKMLFLMQWKDTYPF